MQATCGNHIDPSTQQILDVHQQCTLCSAGLAGRQGHQQIYVTLFIHVIPRHRAEHPHIAEAMAFSQGTDFGTTGLDQDVHETTPLLLRRSQPPDHRAVSAACSSVIIAADPAGSASGPVNAKRA